jgi:hypothetical protein
MSQKQSNADKLAQVRDTIKKEREELKLARELANDAVKNLKLENAQARKQAQELLTNLNLALATFHAKLDENKADNEKDKERFTSALEASLSKEAVASITDEQMTALGNTITAGMKKLADLLPKKTELDMGSFKIELADKLITDKDLKKVVDAIPDKITGKVELKEYGKSKDAGKYLTVRLTDGIKFLDGLRGGGGGIIPQGGGSSSTTTTDPLDGYTQGRQDLDSDPMYVGYENLTHYIITKINFTTGETLYKKGTGTLADNWADRANPTYVEANALYSS